MTRCSRTDCDNEATLVPQIVIPANGWPLDYSPIALTITVPCCAEHISAVRVDDFIDPRLGEKSIFGVVEVLTRGKCPPDWDRAFVNPLAIDPDMQAMLDKIATENGGNDA